MGPILLFFGKLIGLIVVFKFVFDWLTKFKKENGKPGAVARKSIVPLVVKNLFAKVPTPLHESYQKLGKQIGHIFFVDCVLFDHVTINNYEHVRESQNADCWADRPLERTCMERSMGRPLGILVNNGEAWKEVRKYSFKTLRQLGLGKNQTMEAILSTQLQDLLESVEKERTSRANNIVPVNHFFSLSVINVIWGIASGGKFTHDDPGYKKLLQITDGMANMSHSDFVIFNVFYFLIKLCPAAFGYTDLIHTPIYLSQYFTGILKARQQQGFYRTDPRDFIDHFLQKIDEDTTGTFTREQLVMVLVDLFQAGIDTASKTLEFGLMHMILNQSVQKKVQQEIQTVIGKDRSPLYIEDRQNMPYTCATIMEVQRMANIVPLNFRSARTDCYVGDYKIAKGTWAAINLYSVHMDEDFWGDPDVFRPERFLDENNNIINRSRLMAFGGGPRMCIGEQVACATLFTFFVGVLQKYSFTRGHPGEILMPDPSSSFLGRPIPFSATVKLN